MILSFFVIIIVVHAIMISQWTLSFFLQSVGLALFILIGIYAFKGFDFDRLISINSCFVSYGLGSIAGFILFVVVDVAVHPKLPLNIFIITIAISIFGFAIIANAFTRITIKSIPTRKYLIIGKENEVGGLIKDIKSASMGKIEIYKYMNPSPASLTEELKIKSLTNQFDAILVGNSGLEKSVSEIIKDAENQCVNIEYLPIITEEFLKRIPIDLISKFTEYYEVSLAWAKESPSKRIEDVVISSIALTILSPVFLVLYLLIVAEDGRPAFFVQDRVGLNGRIFKIHKFRSMKTVQGQSAKYVKDEKHRITKIGKIMRPIRLDEIPQFYDILMGNMSFVGPRPEQPKFVEELSAKLPYYNLRHKVKPGLTGWAQINYKYASTIEEQSKKLSYDLYYVKNRSIYLDLQIILKTVETVVFRRGAE